MPDDTVPRSTFWITENDWVAELSSAVNTVYAYKAAAKITRAVSVHLYPLISPQLF